MSEQRVFAVFRLMSWIAVVAFPALLLVVMNPTLYANVRAIGPLSVVLDIVAVVGAFCAVIPWPAALGHWRRRYPPHPNWIAWGFALFFGLVPAAWAYWLIGTRAYGSSDQG